MSLTSSLHKEQYQLSCLDLFQEVYNFINSGTAADIFCDWVFFIVSALAAEGFFFCNLGF